MPDKHEILQRDARAPGLSRRQFGAASAAVGVAAAATEAAAAGLPVSEKDVQIKTPDGTCDAFFAHPSTGQHPGVLIWTDAFGLRPAFRDMAKRLAAEGYAVLVPNPFYRLGTAPVVPAGIDFAKADDRAKLGQIMGSVTAAGAAERDATAFVAFLDSQSQVKKGAKIGTQGYCMGGALTMRTAATMPNRIGAGGSFHGGGLATDKPDSPHLLVPKFNASYLIAIADNDDKKEPAAKDILREAFNAAKKTAEIEVYAGADHGWCVPGSAVYNEPAAEKAWARLLALYKTALA